MKNKEEQIDLDGIATMLADEVSKGRPLSGEDGLMKDLMKRVIEASLEAEMDEHLAATRGNSSKNRRNGRGRKNILSSSGGLEIFAPRDRDGSFEPQIVKKRQRRLDGGIDNKILSLYGKGLSYRDIQDHLREIYGVELSVGTLNAITDRILPEILEWQQRPLETVYPVMWLDAMHFKVREHGKVVTKAVYNVLGVNRDGEKQVLGIYFGDSESSSFWRGVLHELKQRGVEDIFVACIDNLSGFGDAIEDIFPRTDVQLCLVSPDAQQYQVCRQQGRKTAHQGLKVHIYGPERRAGQAVPGTGRGKMGCQV